MTPEQMQARSQEKVNQLLNLAKVLHIKIEAVQKVDRQTGIIRNEIYWIDEEKYTPAPVAEQPAEQLAQEEAPVEEKAAEAVEEND